ncbi:MAG: molybdate ABC transporter substrate-binding protein [Rhodospirillaceae bacterium]|nr:molybdate ABC transporter substrate-binding protein [Rhodospirillaceae bacterium]
MRRHFVPTFLVLAAIAVFGYAAPTCAQGADKILVFAASSLTEALTEIGDAYARSGQPRPVFSFAASSTLARQIENGAPAAVFVAADEEWMDYLAARKLIVAGTRNAFLGNSLVLITPADRPLHLRIETGFPLATAIGMGKLALADPDSVPAGRYAKAALENLGVWQAVASNVVRGDGVRSALAFVERGEAAAGIVYATDAMLTRKVAVVGSFPPASHAAISYPLAILAGHDTAAARGFRDFLLGEEAGAVYRKFGFAVK